MPLDLTSNKFSLANAQEAVIYARAAYTAVPTIYDSGTDTRVFIIDLGDYIFVSFCGTRGLRNLFTDARVLRTHTLLGQIHEGFWTAFGTISERLISALRTIQAVRGSVPVIVLGHSLGGSLAMIGAKVLRDAFIPVHSVYTFGCPRVGDSEFQAGYNTSSLPKSPFATLGDATFTVINDCDVVPRVPFWIAGNRRPGRDAFISSLNPSRIVPDPPFTYRLESDGLALWKGWRARKSAICLDQLLADHHVDNYIAALARIVPDEAPPALPLPEVAP